MEILLFKYSQTKKSNLIKITKFSWKEIQSVSHIFFEMLHIKCCVSLKHLSEFAKDFSFTSLLHFQYLLMQIEENNLLI